MNKYFLQAATLLAFFLFPWTIALAQEVQVKLGNSNIAKNELFTISVTLYNEQLKTYSNFPDIPASKKGAFLRSRPRI